jgi:hypothetical protein
MNWILQTLLRRRTERDVDDEIQAHLEEKFARPEGPWGLR